jgi:hypothetical protein
VPAKNVRVPDEFSIVHTAGRTLGMLVYLECISPDFAHGSDSGFRAPLTHRELIWMSAMVRCKDRSYRVPHGIGPLYFVSRMYVDNDVAIEAGQSEWALPRTRARFSRFGNRISVGAEDGTQVAFSFKPRNFSFMAPTRISTLQKGFGRVVCFKARGKAEVQLATYKLERFESAHPDWESFQRAFVLPGVATHLKNFQTTLQAAVEFPRRLDSIAPAPMPV